MKLKLFLLNILKSSNKFMKKNKDDVGSDTNGLTFNSKDEMWEAQLKEGENKWYEDGASYWSKIESTVDGMLGGFAQISKPDIDGSLSFLEEFFQGKHGTGLVKKTRALDCGAGIGRITKNLLVPVFEKVDLLEQNPAFVERAKQLLSGGKVENFYCSSLHTFQFEKKI